MTFTEIVDEVKSRLNLVSSDSTTRIGRTVNRVYRRVTAQTGLNLTRTVLAKSANTSIGSPIVTFTDVEKIIRVYDDSSGTPREIQEVMLTTLREKNPRDSDQAEYWAVQSMTDDDVVIRLDIEPLSVFAIKADGFLTVTTLSGTDVPLFPESFHDLLVEGALVEEYYKMEKIQLARDAKGMYEQLLSEFKYFLNKSAYIEIYQSADNPVRRWMR